MTFDTLFVTPFVICFARLLDDEDDDDDDDEEEDFLPLPEPINFIQTVLKKTFKFTTTSVAMPL